MEKIIEIGPIAPDMGTSPDDSPVHVEDAFGTALKEYYSGNGPETYTTEREDGRSSEAELAHYFEPYEQWAAPTKDALEFVRPGDTVLDIGCGSGRHALWLQEQGHSVVGIDKSEDAIDICRDRGLESCEVMDMTDLQFEDSRFDTVLVVGNIIGLGGELSDTRDLLEELDRITTANGRVIADTQNPFPEGVDDDEYFRTNRIGDRNAAKVRFRVRYDDLIEDWLEIAMFRQDELKSLIAETSWELTDTVEVDPGEGWYSIAMQWYLAILEKAGEED